MKTLKISRDEIIGLIMRTYHLKQVKFMTKGGYEPDHTVYDEFGYVEGEME